MVEIKGLSLNISKKIILTQYGEERFREVIEMLSEQEREVMSGPIWPVGWYPMDLFAHWAAALQKVIFKEDKEGQLKQLVYPTIDEQLKSFYGAHLMFASPEDMLRQVASITGTYFRGVTVEATMLRPGSALVTYTGFEKHHRAIEVSLKVWWQRVLETVAAKSFRFEIVTSIAAGQGCGIYRITWDA